MTMLGAHEEVSGKPLEKGHFRTLRAHQMRNRPPPRRRWKHRGPKTKLKLAELDG